MDSPVTVFVRGPLPLGWLGEIRVPPHSTIVFEQDLRPAKAPERPMKGPSRPMKGPKHGPPRPRLVRGTPEHAAEVARLDAELDEYWARDPRRAGQKGPAASSGV